MVGFWDNLAKGISATSGGRCRGCFRCGQLAPQSPVKWKRTGQPHLSSEGVPVRLFSSFLFFFADHPDRHMWKSVCNPDVVIFSAVTRRWREHHSQHCSRHNAGTPDPKLLGQEEARRARWS